MTNLDIVLVLPGASSLGAYQAGACAGVLVGRNALVEQGCDVRIPALGGASAGATVALLAGHVLAHAIDPVAFLREAWVERVDLDLLSTGREAPLGSEGLRDELADMLLTGADRFALRNSVEPADVAVHVGLTSLRGYGYSLDNLGGRPVGAVSYADWATVHLTAGMDPSTLVTDDGASAVDVVVASTANPFAFPPRLLRRSGAIAARRREAERPAAPSDEMWFTDGGLVQSRPIRRTLDLVDEPADRTHVAVIDPRSEGPSSGDEWSGGGRPTWRSALQRALAIFPAQALSDELAELDTQTRTRTALKELSEHLDVVGSEGYERWLQAHGVTAGASLTEALEAAAGMPPARDVTADVIHPMLTADRDSVERLLAGEILGDFGGFLSRDLRASDFSLGYSSAAEWWARSAADLGFETVEGPLLDALAVSSPPPWSEVDRGRTSVSELSIRAKRRLAVVALRTLRALVGR